MSEGAAALLGAVGRWVGFVASFLVVGAGVFRWGVLRRLGPAEDLNLSPRVARLGLLAASLVLITLPVRLYAQALAFVEPGDPITADLVRVILLETAWGKGWTAQVVAAALAGAGYGAALVPGLPGWAMAAAGASAVSLAGPLTGHAIATDRAGRWGYLIDVLHILGGSAWLGTLGVMVLAGFAATATLPPERYHDLATRMIRTFSPIALIGAGTAIGAGLVLGFFYLEGSFTALWQTAYGRVLSLKLGLLGGVLAFGAWNWRALQPRLHETGTPGLIRRSSQAELAFGTALLAMTAFLVAMPMPGEE